MTVLPTRGLLVWGVVVVLAQAQPTRAFIVLARSMGWTLCATAMDSGKAAQRKHILALPQTDEKSPRRYKYGVGKEDARRRRCAVCAWRSRASELEPVPPSAEGPSAAARPSCHSDITRTACWQKTAQPRRRRRRLADHPAAGGLHAGSQQQAGYTAQARVREHVSGYAARYEHAT